MSKKLLMNTNTNTQDNYRRYYQEYEGTFITVTDKSEDDTIDTSRFIEVTEIWGNTWQDTEIGKNKFNIATTRRGLYISSSGVETPHVSHDSSDYIEVKSSTNYVCSRAIGFYFYDSSKTFISYAYGLTKTTPANCKYLVVCGGTIEDTLQIEEGTVSTSFEAYKPPDLSNIQSIGELYVDDEGNPILDDLGREQYKIEIMVGEPYFSIDDIQGTYGLGSWNLYQFESLKFNVHKDCFELVANMGEATKPYQYYYVFANNAGCWVRLHSTIKEDAINELNKRIISMKTHNKTTILLPCQLQKVGDVYDRLYWDSEKRKYVVEKKILKYSTTKETNYINLSAHGTNNSYPVYTNSIPNITKKFSSNYGISSVFGDSYGDDRVNVKGFIVQNTFAYFRVGFDYLDSHDFAGIKKYLQENLMDIYYQSQTPELIETNITEKIQLPCYSEKTHIFVNSTIDTTMKVLVPYKEIV